MEAVGFTGKPNSILTWSSAWVNSNLELLSLLYTFHISPSRGAVSQRGPNTSIVQMDIIFKKQTIPESPKAGFSCMLLNIGAQPEYSLENFPGV